MPLGVFQVLFKVNLTFKDFSRQSCIFKYFSSLCEPCILYLPSTSTLYTWASPGDNDTYQECEVTSHLCGQLPSRARFVCVDALCPSQQFFSHFGTISRLPGLNQY